METLKNTIGILADIGGVSFLAFLAVALGQDLRDYLRRRKGLGLRSYSEWPPR